MKKIKKYYRIVIILTTILQLSSCTTDDSEETLTEITGEAMFWVSSDLGVGSITVSCNGITRTINSFYSAGSPDCGVAGAANFSLNPGTYSYTASGGSLSWNGTITVISGDCSKIQLIVSGTAGNLSLNGKWLGLDGRTFTISGASGVFNSFGTGNWKSAFERGLVNIGDLYLKNISNINATKWNAQPLWVAGSNGVVNEVKWGTDGTIVISSNGNTFTLTATDPFDGTSTRSATFTRVN